MEVRVVTEIGSILVATLATGSLLIVLLASRFRHGAPKPGASEDDSASVLRLRRQELMFDKEYEAASALSALVRQFLPTFSFPAMDWGTACDEIAYDFSKIDTAIGDFLLRHSAALPPETSALLGECLGITREHRFKVTTLEVPSAANRAAASLYEKLWRAENELLRQLHD